MPNGPADCEEQVERDEDEEGEAELPAGANAEVGGCNGSSKKTCAMLIGVMAKRRKTSEPIRAKHRILFYHAAD